MHKYLRVENYRRKLNAILTRSAAGSRTHRARKILHEVFGESFQPALTLIDIGASGELPEAWRGLGPYLRVVGFEPDEEAFEELQGSHNGGREERRYLKTALWKNAAELNFYKARKSMVSSMFLPNRELVARFPNAQRFDIVSTEKVHAVSLDVALRNAGISEADFLKLDTQGSELAILQGAGGMLSEKVLGVEIEVEFAELYRDQPLFCDVDRHLRQFEFVFMDFPHCTAWKKNPNNKGRGQLMAADALYLRAISAMPARKDAFLKAAAICAFYDCFDYASVLLEEARRRGVLDAHEYSRIVCTLL